MQIIVQELFYAHGTLGYDRDHSYFGLDASACIEQSKKVGKDYTMHGKSEATGPGHE